MTRDIRTKALIGLILLGLGGAPAWGADRTREEARPMKTLRVVVTATWNLLQSVWGKNGSSLDPFGTPQSGNPSAGQTSTPTASESGDAGSSLDPFGTH
jgi:hypothetical protein